MAVKYHCVLVFISRLALISSQSAVNQHGIWIDMSCLLGDGNKGNWEQIWFKGFHFRWKRCCLITFHTSLRWFYRKHFFLPFFMSHLTCNAGYFFFPKRKPFPSRFIHAYGQLSFLYRSMLSEYYGLRLQYLYDLFLFPNAYEKFSQFVCKKYSI